MKNMITLISENYGKLWTFGLNKTLEYCKQSLNDHFCRSRKIVSENKGSYIYEPQFKGFQKEAKTQAATWVGIIIGILLGIKNPAIVFSYFKNFSRAKLKVLD